MKKLTREQFGGTTETGLFYHLYYLLDIIEDDNYDDILFGSGHSTAQMLWYPTRSYVESYEEEKL
jgi:hypothetical protein